MGRRAQAEEKRREGWGGAPDPSGTETLWEQWEQLKLVRWAGLSLHTQGLWDPKDAVPFSKFSLLVFHWEYPFLLYWLHLHGSRASGPTEPGEDQARAPGRSMGKMGWGRRQPTPPLPAHELHNSEPQFYCLQKKR